MRSLVKMFLMSGVAFSTLSGALSAQTTADNDAEDQENAKFTLEEIVVTGTSAARRDLSTPLSVTQIGESELRRLSSSSQADILRTIPAIKAEGGGGEVAANVFIKGLPSGGQFQFTPLQYDGIAVFSTFGLNSSAFDVYYRNDLGIEQLEFVRGGVSNLFGTGSVAGIINYISKTGTDEEQGTVQLEYAEEGRLRGDFATSGPLAENTYYALSGFYRYDEGPLDTGLETEGFQLRGNIKRDFADGSGSMTIYGQYIDDEVQFFLPFPLDGETRNRPIGNDGEIINTLQTSEAANLSFQTPNGVFETPIGDGVNTQGGSIAFAFEREFEDGWGVNAKAKYSDYSHEFNLFLDGDGVVNTPETQAGFLAARGLTDLQSASFTFSQSGRELADSDLLFGNRLLDRNRPAQDVTTELNITRELEAAGFTHNFTLGGFFARSEADDETVLTTYLGEFNDQPRLVDLNIVDADGNAITFSDNGLLNAGAGFGNNRHEATRFAGYIADQFENDRWVFDVGFRLERFEGDISREGSQNFLVNDDPTLAPNLQNVRFGNGDFTIGEVSDTEWALALGALYRLNDDTSLYANFSRGFFFPQIRSVRFNQFREPATFNAEIIKQAEIGTKYKAENFALTLAGFYTELTDRANVDFVNDGQGGVIEQTSFQSTETFGVEATATVFLTESLRFDGNITFQDHEFTEFDGAPEFEGNELRRQPNVLFNSALTYDDGAFDATVSQNYVGSNFANDSNSVRLGSFNIVRLDAGYRLPLGGNQSARVGISVFNLFDSEGVTEGSPRQGSSQSATGNFFVGRPILPRRITVRLTYDF